jgi:hypothetical protein
VQVHCGRSVRYTAGSAAVSHGGLGELLRSEWVLLCDTTLVPVRSPRIVPMPIWDAVPMQWGPDLV